MEVQQITVWTTKVKLVAATVSLLFLAAGLGAAEIYARHVQNYSLWSGKLHKTFFSDSEQLKIYNRRFYESKRASFKDWPIQLELFNADKAEPRYLFKPNLRMVKDGRRLLPAEAGEATYWSSNSWGFRGAEFSREKAEGTIRIVCLGASTTEGSQKDTETYPFFLQQELNHPSQKTRVEVINAGHHGQNIRDLLEILRQRIFPLKPDVIVFYEAANNIGFHEFAKVASCQPGDCWLKSYGGSYQWFYQHIAAFGMITNRLDMNQRVPKEMRHRFDASLPKKSVSFYRNGLSEIVKETLKRKITIVLTSFVTLAHRNLVVTYEANPLVFDDLYRKWYPITADEFFQIYDSFNRQSKEIAQEYGVPYADVAADFPQELRYFPFDLIHLSPDGNRLLAKKFSTFLSQKVFLNVVPKDPS